MPAKKKKAAAPARRKIRPAASASVKKGAPNTEGSCDVCGASVQDIHCRLVCPKCGATRDCSDP